MSALYKAGHTKPGLERMIDISEQFHTQKSSLLSFAHIRLFAFRYPGMVVRALEKMRGADGLHWGMVSNLKRIMAHEPQKWCEALKF